MRSAQISAAVGFLDIRFKKRERAATPAASKHYAKELMKEVNADREARGKKPFEDDDEPPKPPKK